MGPQRSARTLPDLLRDDDAPFLHCEDQTWSYAEFALAVDEVASGLLELGVGRGDRVAIAAPNSAEWIITWFAVARLGAVLVTLNVAYREREFEYMINQSSASVLVCCASDGSFDFVEFLERMRPQLPTVRHYVFIGGTGFSGSREWRELRVPVEQEALRSLADQVSAGDPAVILYTSGTTGLPKGATLTHGSIVSSATAQVAHLQQTADDVSIGHMPLNHVGGMTCTVAAAMSAGGQVALLPRYSPADALDAIDRHGVTVYIGVPTMYTLVMDLPEFATAETSSIRTCIIGGSNVEPALGRRILETFSGARMANLYGLSETSGGCIISDPDDDLETLVATLGVPIGNFEIRIQNDAGEPLPADTAGELMVKGGCVASGYWLDQIESERTFRPDGWLATGDIAMVRADGRVMLCGRKKEMYVRSGYNVYPAEIENVLARATSVAMCAVIGVSDQLYGEVGHAYVVPVPGKQVDVDELLEDCRSQLAKYKVPAAIHVVDSLPLTPSGKIRKVALRELAASDDPALG